MTKKKMEENEKLEKVSYIWYLITFKEQTKAQLDLKSKFNAMKQVFIY